MADKELDIDTLVRVKAELQKFWDEQVSGAMYDPTNEAAVNAVCLAAIDFAADIAGLEMIEEYVDGEWAAMLDQADDYDGDPSDDADGEHEDDPDGSHSTDLGGPYDPGPADPEKE
jgi:hypothetical protein